MPEKFALSIEAMLEMADRDSDVASMFVIGESWDVAQGVVIIVKGGNEAEIARDVFINLGFVTPGKGVEDDAGAGEVSLPPFTIEDPATGEREHHETETQRITREVANEFRGRIEESLRAAERSMEARTEREVFHHADTARVMMQEVRAALAKADLVVLESEADGQKGGCQG